MCNVFAGYLTYRFFLLRVIIGLMKKTCSLTTHNMHLQSHEFHSVRILLAEGFDIELIPSSRIKGLHLPDIMLAGVPWEIKAPEGDGKNTIKHNIQNAAHQSENVIIDLFRCKLSEDIAMKDIQHHFSLSKRLKRMKVITKSGKIIDLRK